MGRLDGNYGRSVMEDEAEKTVETNRAIARWLDEIRKITEIMTPEERKWFFSQAPTLTHAEKVAPGPTSEPQSTVNLRSGVRKPHSPSTRNTSTTPDRERTES